MALNEKSVWKVLKLVVLSDLIFEMEERNWYCSEVKLVMIESSYWKSLSSKFPLKSLLNIWILIPHVPYTNLESIPEKIDQMIN